MRNLIIVSAGGLGREVFVWAWAAMMRAGPEGPSFTIGGFLDDRPDMLERVGFVHGEIITSVESYEPAEDDFFVIAIGDPQVKKWYADKLDANGAKWGNVVHPTASVGFHVSIGLGSIIGPFCQLSANIALGRHVFFGTHSNTAHDTRFGAFAHVCGSCEINGRAKVDQGAFIGSHATILPDAHVGEWSYVGAGSVVLRRVAPRTRVFGNPAVEVK